MVCATDDECPNCDAPLIDEDDAGNAKCRFCGWRANAKQEQGKRTPGGQHPPQG